MPTPEGPASSRGDRERAARERAFFERQVEECGDLFWAEKTPIAGLRRRMRARRLCEAAGVADDGTGRVVLDVGCGTASYTIPLAGATRARIVAVDLTRVLLSRAAGSVPENVDLACADAGRLPFPDARFDAVVGNAILHHLPLGSAVPELLRVLRPGGHFCFAEPNLVNPHVFLGLRVPALRRRSGASPDETAFVRWRLRARLETLGLEEVEVRPFDFLYPLTPRAWIGAVEKLGGALEAIPLVRELAGSLLVTGRKT